MSQESLDQSDKPSPSLPLGHKYRSKRPYNKKVHGKRYPLAQKIAIKSMQSLVDDGSMTVTDVAKHSGTTRMQVYRVWDDPSLEELSPTVVSKTKKGLSGIFYKRALESTMNMTQLKFDQASLLQLATVAGIMTEKGRLMEGLSTENHSHLGFIGNLEADREKLMKRLDNVDGKTEK